MIATVVIATVNGAATILYLSIWGTWKIAGVQAGIMAAIANHKKEVADSIEVHQRIMGETIAAVRQKINEVELWGRDHFVRSDEFTHALADINQTMTRMDDSLGARLIRMETKIDAASTRRGQQGGD